MYRLYNSTFRKVRIRFGAIFLGGKIGFFSSNLTNFAADSAGPNRNSTKFNQSSATITPILWRLAGRHGGFDLERAAFLFHMIGQTTQISESIWAACSEAWQHFRSATAFWLPLQFSNVDAPDTRVSRTASAFLANSGGSA